ncbi:hypothetical protein PR202_ga23684 [Eleusine coracana subsp. coracana]|uniref:Glycosyltransferase 61 catalytic domain-containing protein n=1 Tax=Eleusine coracana subsp. coracana TaxID=191504 RepID=A0AAV5D6F0_ELECO|nr:hypothetical protein PR202_ga23684 [Eleusine coracana subsp. coracana]
MCWIEVKPRPWGSPKCWELRRLIVGSVIGVSLVLLAYLVVSQQFAISAHNAQWITAAQQTRAPCEKAERGNVVVCNTEGLYSDTCEVDGDVRTNGTALSVAVVVTTTGSSEQLEWKIKPYARRTVSVKEVTVTQLPNQSTAPPPCTVNHSIPAVVFALGGHAGNYWHAFCDVLVPLFVASRRYDGEVLFLVTNIQPWWLVKYKTIIQRLSKYDAVDMDADAEVRCFGHVTVGLRIDKLFSIVPDLAPGPGGRRLTMVDFTAFLREAYALPRGAPPVASPSRDKQRRPRLLLMRRGHNRRIVNEDEIVRAAEAAGFEAEVVELPRYGRVDEQAPTVNAFDALMGVHGAGLTHAVFLPTGGVLIQVVPYGRMEAIARAEFGAPAGDMGLHYLEYSVTAEESTLMETLGPEHPAVRDPESVHRSGWDKVNEFYLDKQDVRINVTRLAPTLAQAFDHLRQQQL